MTFKCEDELDNHINQVHMFKCDLCGVYEFEESELRDHIEEHHGSSLEPPAEANDDKHEEEVDKASVKPRKLKNNDSIWLEKSATVKVDPLMSTCQCGCSKPGKVLL